MLVGPRKCLKQTIQIELNRVKNPDWPEANQRWLFTNQLAIYKLAFRAGRDLNSAPQSYKSSALPTQPSCLLVNKAPFE